MKVTNIKKTIRSTKRLTHILKVLSNFGFKEIIVDLGLDNFISRKKNGDLPETDLDASKFSSPPLRKYHWQPLQWLRFIGQNWQTEARWC